MNQDDKINLKLEKEKRIKKEKSRLTKLFSNIPKAEFDTVLKLIDNAAFMSVTLAELQDEINTNGPVEDYQNGANQWGRKKSAAADIHIVMTKNYQSVIKQLVDMQRPHANDGKEDELMDFIK